MNVLKLSLVPAAALAVMLVATSAQATVVWEDDFSYATGDTPADEAPFNAAGWSALGAATFDSDYGITPGQNLWGNIGFGMPELRASTGYILLAGDEINVTVDRTRFDGYEYTVKISAWDGSTATNLSTTVITGSSNPTLASAVAGAAVAGQELIIDYQHTANWGETASISVDVVPEPASLALLGLGGLMMIRRRRA